MPLQIDQETRYFILHQFDFSGGLNTRDLDTVIEESELSDVEDFSYDKRGALQTRKGYTKMSTTPYGTGNLESLGVYYKLGADPAIIAAKGTVLGKFNDSTGEFSDIETGLTSGKKVSMHQFMNHFYMANGTDKVRVYDGTSVWEAGYTKPATAVSAAQGATGVLLAGKYKYHVTYYYKDGESNPNDTETEVTITADKKIELSNIPTGGSRVTQRKLYRTTKDGDEFHLLTTIEDNTTTTYSDNIPDGGLGATMEEDNDIPPVASMILNHKARLWYAGDPDNPSRLYFSKALHPESVSSFGYWDIGRDDGDIITGLAVNLGALVIFKQYSTWVISGDLPTGDSPDMVLEKVNPTAGIVSQFSSTHAGNDVLFMTPNSGVHRLHRVLLAQTETMDVQAISDKIFGTIKDLNRDKLSRCHSIVYNRNFYVFVPSGVEQDECNTALVLDLRKLYPAEEYTISWTKYTNMNFASSCLYLDDEGEKLIVGGQNGHLYQLENGASDDGATITPNATTKWFDLGGIAENKTLRQFYTYGRGSEDFQFTIRLYRNEGANIIQHDLMDFEGGGEVGDEDVLFDTQLFDNSTFDNESGITNVIYDFTKAKLLTRHGKLFKIKIEQVAANQEFLWYGFEVRGFLANPLPQK